MKDIRGWCLLAEDADIAMKKYFVVLGLIVSLVLPLKTAASSIVKDGLVSYWTFDKRDISGDIARDVVGDNDATMLGNPTVVNGQVGNALAFDGIDDYVNLTNLGDFGTKVGNATFEVWIKTSVIEDWMVLFKQRLFIDCVSCWGIDLNGRERGIVIEAEEGSVVCYLCSGVGENGCNELYPREKFAIFDGKWHHIAYVSKTYFEDGEHPLTGEPIKYWIKRQFIYVDGVEHSFPLLRSFIAGFFTEFPDPVYLGAKEEIQFGQGPKKFHGFFKGVIDEVRVYQRSLTIDEVHQNFEARGGLKVELGDKLTTSWGALKGAKQNNFLLN